MIIQFVKFKSGLSADEVERVIKERAPDYRALPGLLQKYYGREQGTGDICGVYIWDGEESLREFRESELAKTIASAYEVTGAPRTELFDLLVQVRETAPTAGSKARA